MHQKYWNPILETLSREKLRALQLKKFKRIFEWAYEKSRFHRSLYDAAGIAPEDIRSFDDIHLIPKVEKSMMRDIQRKAPFPYGDALCVPLEEVTEFRQTSGTTGQAGVPAGYLARLGVVGRMLVFYSVGSGVPSLPTGCLSLLGTTSSWPSGPGTMRRRNWAARWFREAYWIQRPGY